MANQQSKALTTGEMPLRLAPMRRNQRATEIEIALLRPQRDVREHLLSPEVTE